MLAIDDSGDRKDGNATAHVGHQWLGRYGRTDNGVVTVTTLWSDGDLYYPLHADPYTPAKHFDKGKSDLGFRTKLQIGAVLARRAEAAGFPFRAVAADSAYGDQDGFRGELREAGLPFVMALKPRHGTWAYGRDAHTPIDAARTLAWDGPDDPGEWQAVERTFHDGHTGTWYAADATLGAWGPDGHTRLVVATKDPASLPEKATWYLATNLPRPGSRAKPRANIHRRTWPRLPGSMASATGSSRPTSRSRTSSAGPVSKSAPIPPYTGIKHSSTARSASAGMPTSTRTRPRIRRSPPHRYYEPRVRRGGSQNPVPARTVSWPRALRQVRAWLTPSVTLQRWWQAWTNAPPPPQLQALIDAVTAGQGLHLYLLN